LSIPVHAHADCGDAVVHEHGPGAVPPWWGSAIRLGAVQDRLPVLRASDDAARVLGGLALARLARLRILAVPFRRRDILGRAVAHELGQRAEQARLLRNKRAADSHWSSARAPRLCGVRWTGRGVLSRASLPAGIQGQPAFS